MIFSRQGGGRHAKADNAKAEATKRAAERRTPAEDLPAPARADEPAGGIGPWDVTEAPAGVRLDLGALQVPAVEGVDLRVQADNEGVIQQVMLVRGDSALQLGVFAAPKGEGIWDEVRAEIRKSLFDEGVAAEEAPGDYGVELRARVRTAEGLADLRFVGVDGPRWMVRGLFQGPVAVDPAVAPQLGDCLRGLVVSRGNDAKPVREPLMLRLPKEMAEAAAAGDGTAVAAAAQPMPAADERRKPSPRPRRL
ncbi:DUF3710 domain-containing protein [Hamadaea tsunoensis]|uniref:DUF3710 domain-containing protein n=1 Tax=Hamadaea tsunoensis TaxID=53368 RepID=UPI00041E2277|nr:DUF3710 domain-containing protein [Hamadaea tsunoensis]